MLSAHAPTEHKDEMEKEKFYNLLSKTCDQVPKYDISLATLMQKIGKKQHITQVTGKYTIHNETSANGKLLTQSA
jgi:hypothetical protein